jgi:hypothetical protein
MTASPIPIGARVHVSDEHYTGLAIVLEYDPVGVDDGGPYYCHLVALCDHEMCPDDDDCLGAECRGWYAIESKGQA